MSVAIGPNKLGVDRDLPVNDFTVELNSFPTDKYTFYDHNQANTAEGAEGKKDHISYASYTNGNEMTPT